MKYWRTKFARTFAAFVVTVAAFSPVPASADHSQTKSAELPGIHNFLRASDKVFSGSQPEGDEAFAALAQQGVTTIVSVDGAKPDVKGAAKRGIRYIHLPVGYDGISKSRITELVKVVATVPGPVYVHCHHGKHRGPAAVAVMCMASDAWTKDRAEAFLNQAGTSPEYAGLFRAVNGFTLPEPAKLAAVSTNFPSVAKTSSLVESMVAMDRIYDNLKLAQAAGWQTPTDHPDIDPAHEALMLLEQFREMARTNDTTERPVDYQTKLDDAVKAAEALHSNLKLTLPANTGRDAALKRIGQSCANCHKSHRNE
jgi:protein tyrosine phosphatase (PTP) superfamily phosphohydrolase (DUF442 family)